jgi:hypothetical protein
MVSGLRYLTFLCLLISRGILFSQEAADFLPSSVGTSWTYHTIEALDDSVISELTYHDTLVTIESEDEYTVYRVNSLNTQYALYTSGGSLLYDLTEIIGSDFYGVEIDLDTRVDIARFTADVGSGWEIYQTEQTITLTDSLLELVSSTIEIDDEADIILTIRGERRANQNITVPVGALDAYIFDTLIDLDMVIYAYVFNIRIPVPISILDDYRIRTYYAEGKGVVSRVTDTYDVYLTNESLNLNEYLFTIAGSITTMTEFTDPVTSAPELPVYHAESFDLNQNYPNPFNPMTLISFTLPSAGEVSLTIFNVYGQEIARLIDDAVLTAGKHSIVFNAESLPSGVYFYRISSGSYTKTMRMILIR